MREGGREGGREGREGERGMRGGRDEEERKDERRKRAKGKKDINIKRNEQNEHLWMYMFAQHCTHSLLTCNLQVVCIQRSVSRLVALDHVFHPPTSS